MNVNLNITGMTCTHCERAVREALEAVSGVEKVSIDRSSGTASVTGTADPALLVAAVTEEGYRAQQAS